MSSKQALSFTELLTMVALVALELWLPIDAGYEPVRWLARAGAAGLVLVAWRRDRSAETGGTVSRRRAWLEAAGATAGVALLLFGWLRATAEPYDEADLAFLASASTLALWLGRRLMLAALQQVVLQLFLWPRLREIAGRTSGATGGAALLAAGLFGVFHLPSIALAVATALAAVVWISLYRRSRRLTPLIASHALLAGLASIAVPERQFYDLHAGAVAVDNLPHYRALGRDGTRAALRRTTSPEFRAHHDGTPEGYVRGLYRDVLGRPAAAEEIAEWRERLRHESLVEMAKALVLSPERRDAGIALAEIEPDVEPLAPGLARHPRDDGFSGWYDGEGAWRWTRSETPRIRFQLTPDLERSYLLGLTCGAFVPQTLDLRLDGRSLGLVAFETLEPTTRRRVVGPDDFGSSDVHELTLESVGSEPRSAPSGDGRELGLGFRALELRPLRFPSVAVTHLDDDYFLSGFSSAEANLRWSEQPVARLVYPLRRVEDGSRYLLRLTAGTLGTQVVETRVNGTTVGTWTLEGLTPRVHEARLDAALLRSGPNEVAFHLPDARSLAGDPRSLGIALVALRIAPAAGP